MDPDTLGSATAQYVLAAGCIVFASVIAFLFRLLVKRDDVHAKELKAIADDHSRTIRALADRLDTEQRERREEAQGWLREILKVSTEMSDALRELKGSTSRLADMIEGME